MNQNCLYFDVLTSYFNVTVIQVLCNYKIFSKQGYLFTDYFTCVSLWISAIYYNIYVSVTYMGSKISGGGGNVFRLNNTVHLFQLIIHNDIILCWRA